MTSIRIIDCHQIPMRDSTIASVQVVQGEPEIGMLFSIERTSERWKVIGFGTMPARRSLQPESDLILSFQRVDGDSQLAEGQELTECETAM